MVIAPRLYRRLLGDALALPFGASAWGDTHLELPPDDAGDALHNVITGRTLQPIPLGERRVVLASEALDEFPVAVLTRGCQASGTAARTAHDIGPKGT